MTPQIGCDIRTVLRQNISSHALFTQKVSTFTTLSHGTMFIRICENLAMYIPVEL